MICVRWRRRWLIFRSISVRRPRRSSKCAATDNLQRWLQRSERRFARSTRICRSRRSFRCARNTTGLSREKLLARLTGIFGTLALALAALGFYGLLSFNVRRRTAEIGVRMAMGATPAQVHTLVLRQTLWILMAGIVPGIILTEMASRGVQSLLYGSGAIDFWALGFAIVVLCGVGVLAAWVPARRASGIDPVVALRAEWNALA